MKIISKHIIISACILFICYSSLSAQVFYLYDDFDNDATRFNHFFNRWGGNWGLLNAEPLSPYTCCFFPNSHSTDTRNGEGRCLKISYDYGSNVSWGGGYWSSLFLHVDSLNRTVNFTDLFEGTSSPLLGKAQVDSISFWARSTEEYKLEVELKDYRDLATHQAYQQFILSGDSLWHRYSSSIRDFVDWSNVDSTQMKKLSFILKADLNNEVDTGTIWIDDIGFIDAHRVIPDLTSDKNFLSYVEALTLQYFWDFHDSKGLALDRSTFSDLVSISAVGFQISAIIIGAKNGTIRIQVAENKILDILETLWNAPHGSEQENINAPFRYATCEGLWYHFLQSGSLTRKNPAFPGLEPPELSLFDTALLLAGVISAREFFNSNPDIVRLADSLYLQTNWNFLLNRNTSDVHFGRLHLGWSPENGIIPYAMDYFTEEDILVNLLSLGSPTFPAPRSTFENVKREAGSYQNVSHIRSAPGALFTYMFAQLWCKFPDDSLDVHPDGGLDYWKNTYDAIQTNYSFCQDKYASYPWWDQRIFGLTASEGPDSAYCNGSSHPNYHAYGAEPSLDRVDHNGTFAAYGAGMAVFHQPNRGIDALRFYASIPNYFHPLFGFYDAFHLAPDSYPDSCIQMGYNGKWINDAVFGIDAGPMLIMIDNYLSEKVDSTNSIRAYFTQNQSIQKSMGIMYRDSTSGFPNTELSSFRIFPNPFKNEVIFDLTLEKPSEIIIDLFDFTGKHLANITNSTFPSGPLTMIWSALSDGISFSNQIIMCRIQVNNQVIMKKLVHFQE